MADDSKTGPGATKGLGRGLTLAIVAAVLLGGAGALYVMAGASFKPASTTAFAPLAKGPMSKLQDITPTPPPTASFVDASGKVLHLADLKGDVLVVNLWATWCGPCVKEMPTLATLQKAYAGKPVKVVAISIDGAKDTDKAKAFIATHAPLAFYQDPSLNLPFAFKPPAPGFPTTILFDRAGQERGRVSGDTDWSTPEARAVIDRLLAS